MFECYLKVPDLSLLRLYLLRPNGDEVGEHSTLGVDELHYEADLAMPGGSESWFVWLKIEPLIMLLLVFVTIQWQSKAA